MRAPSCRRRVHQLAALESTRRPCPHLFPMIVCCSIPYTLEVMRAGAELGSIGLGGRGHWCLGRAPTNDIVLDHPSSSRCVGGRAPGGGWCGGGRLLAVWWRLASHPAGSFSCSRCLPHARRRPAPALRLMPAPLIAPAARCCSLHAVIQFRGSDGAAFVLDPGSTHGTYLNKKRLPPNTHVPLR